MKKLIIFFFAAVSLPNLVLATKYISTIPANELILLNSWHCYGDNNIHFGFLPENHKDHKKSKLSISVYNSIMPHPSHMGKLLFFHEDVCEVLNKKIVCVFHQGTLIVNNQWEEKTFYVPVEEGEEHSSFEALGTFRSSQTSNIQDTNIRCHIIPNQSQKRVFNK